MFGHDFAPAVAPIIWLLPGIAALSGAKVLGSYFFSQARLGIVSATAMISLVATILFDLLLIPSLGIRGAALASSIAYTVSLAAALRFYSKMSGQSAWDCIIPRAADLALYVGLARRLRRAKAQPTLDGAAAPRT